MKKLILTLFLTIVLSNTIFAASVSEQIKSRIIHDDYRDIDLQKGDDIIVTFGKYPQSDESGNEKEPIEWVVLHEKSDKALLVSKYVLNAKAFDENKRYKNGVHVKWEDSTIRSWLNQIFIDEAFNSNEKSQILDTNLTDVRRTDDYSPYADSNIEAINATDKVFCLSYTEICKYYGYDRKSFTGNDDELEIVLHDKHMIETEKTAYAIANDNSNHGSNSSASDYNFWLRDCCWSDTAQSDGFYAVEIMKTELTDYDDDFLSINRDSPGVVKGVRPAIWVSLNDSSSSDDLSNEEGKYVDFFGEKVPVTGRLEDAAHGEVKITNEADRQKLIEMGILNAEDITETTIRETTQAPKNGWEGDYYYKNGSLVKNQWVEYGKDWYYCGPSGAILKNQWIDKTYYVDSEGKMLRNTTTPDGNRVDADGRYIPEEVIDLDAKKEIKTPQETTQSAQNILGDNVHIEGADIIQNEDGSIQIGGTPGKGAKVLQKANDISNKNSQPPISIKERDKYILSDDGHTMVFQITKSMLPDGVSTELNVSVPDYEHDTFAKTYAKVGFWVNADVPTSEEIDLINNKLNKSNIVAIDDGVGGKYDYAMIKRAGGIGLNNKFDFATISKKEATRIKDELNKKLENNGKIILRIQYDEWDTDKGTYVKNPIYIGRGKAVVKKEGLIFKKLSMYVEFEGEAKKRLEKYTRENKGKYLYLTDGGVDDGSGAIDNSSDIKYDDDFQKEINKIFSGGGIDDTGREDYNTLQVIKNTISDGKIYVNMLGREFADKDPKIFTDVDKGYEYALRIASGFPLELYIIDGVENYTK